MIFANTGNHCINLKLGNNDITQSHQERFLGVLMDDKLTWKSHRAAIAKKISRNAGIFFRARHLFKLTTLKTLYYSFIQSHLIYCSTIWGTGSKNSLQKIFIAQKKAIRAITFTNLYTKDKISETYSYGHTKYLFNSNEFLTVHNLILVQMLSHMQKIYSLTAPIHIRTLFYNHTPPLQPTPIVTSHKKLLKLGLDINNILPAKHDQLTYFTVTNPRLQKQKYSLLYLGPLTYNHFSNKIQLNLNLNNLKYSIHRLTPKCFSSHIKKQILSEQSLGEPTSWEAQNLPMYQITNNTTLLRSHQPLRTSAL